MCYLPIYMFNTYVCAKIQHLSTWKQTPLPLSFRVNIWWLQNSSSPISIRCRLKPKTRWHFQRIIATATRAVMLLLLCYTIKGLHCNKSPTIILAHKSLCYMMLVYLPFSLSYSNGHFAGLRISVPALHKEGCINCVVCATCDNQEANSGTDFDLSSF